MWCTRWYLPLVLLPLPIAPPYFLLLFLLSTTLHAKPCFYCIILLSAMFMSSCYWPPVPIDTPLSTPWTDNITTFSAALLSRIPNLPNHMIPAAVPITDRCWCDFSEGLFEPFNTTRWEESSVERLVRELETKMLEASRQSADDAKVSEGQSASPTTAPCDEAKSTRSSSRGLLGGVWPFMRTSPHSQDISSAPTHSWTSSNETVGSDAPVAEQRHRLSQSSPRSLQKIFLGVRREYDLRPYGFDMVVDLGWSR